MKQPAPNPFSAAEFLLSVAGPAQLPAADRPEIAFAGRSNAGKSSAMNALCGRRSLARVSKTPGRTQLLNFFEMPRGRLVDLPGYGFADVPEKVRKSWGPLITGYLKSRNTLRGIVLITDARRPMGAFDQQMLAWATEYSRPAHVLLSKSDKLKSGAARATLRDVRQMLAGTDCSVQLFSATKRTGVEDARRALERWLASEGVDTEPR